MIFLPLRGVVCGCLVNWWRAMSNNTHAAERPTENLKGLFHGSKKLSEREFALERDLLEYFNNQ
jgi:hypothetical protein